MGNKAKKGNSAQKEGGWKNPFEQLDHDGDTVMDGAAQPSSKQQTRYTLEQRTATTRIRKCDEQRYYDILGLKKNCSQADIRKAYRTLAKLTHPDQNKFEDAQIAFKKLGSAYQVLGDISERKRYDAKRSRFIPGENRDPLDIFGEEFAENAGGDDSDDPSSGDDSESDEDPDVPDETVTKLYEEATPLVNQFLSFPDKSSRKMLQEGLQNLNRSIQVQNKKAGRPNESSLINIKLLTGFGMEYCKALQQLQGDPTDPRALSSVKRIQKQFNHSMKGYNYPNSWKLPAPPSIARAADQEEEIIGYRPHKNQSQVRFIVKSSDYPGGIEIKNDFSVGSDAVKAYMQLPESERKDIRFSADRYNQTLRFTYKRILGWTNDIGSTLLETRRALPTGYGLIEFTDNTTDILTRTALRNLLGARSADNEINRFYRDRQLVPPWAYMPKLRRLEGREWARIEGHASAPGTSRKEMDMRTAPSGATGQKSSESGDDIERLIKIVEGSRSDMKTLAEALIQAVAHLSIKTAK
ncbi:DnaJ domain-containing protein [Aspergillus pseudoustus]|uniref:DnaJ domain-containing protein n=1 Tax=Aspergillus pseudoustus TaxID=1810923 RepID=A0ABR4IW13_9EURO